MSSALPWLHSRVNRASGFGKYTAEISTPSAVVIFRISALVQVRRRRRLKQDAVDDATAHERAAQRNQPPEAEAPRGKQPANPNRCRSAKMDLPQVALLIRR